MEHNTTDTTDISTRRMMPGRAVDIVHAATLRVTGEQPWRIEIFLSTLETRRIHLQLIDTATEATAYKIFAALGVDDPAIRRYHSSSTGGDMCGYVPDLGAELRVFVNLPPLPDPAKIRALVDEADDLVARVDAERAVDAEEFQ